MKDLPTSVPFGLIMIGICLTLAGAALFYSSFKETRYIETEGEIISTEIRKTLSNMSSSTARSTLWQLFVVYKFEHNGEMFENDQVSASPPTSSASFDAEPSANLEQLKTRFQPGARVPVYFAKGRPKTSILIKNGVGFPITALIGLLFLAGGIYLRRL